MRRVLVEHYQGPGSRVWGAGSRIQRARWDILVNRSLSIGRVKDEDESERREGVKCIGW